MGKYIVFDGMDGSGKGTQLRLLEKDFSHAAVFTREPGGTPLAEDIRKIVRDSPLARKSTALSNFLLFWAAREELQQNFVTPMLRSGEHVLSDRGDSSTFAYQICGEEHEELLDLFVSMRKLVFDEDAGRRAPDLYIIFDLPSGVARARVMQDSCREKTHFDARDIGYYERVRNGFRRFSERHPVIFIDAMQTPEEMHRSLVKILATEMLETNLPLQ
ncbi:MAG: dTMP kinase, partial [Patescibacteria group bacterium]|nr:dTMP kinase [Patescibacteria group bacterium]